MLVLVINITNLNFQTQTNFIKYNTKHFEQNIFIKYKINDNYYVTNVRSSLKII